MIKVPESLFCYFEQAGITRTIPPGGLIYMQGEPSGTIYLIKKGRVRIYYICLLYTSSPKSISPSSAEMPRRFAALPEKRQPAAAWMQVS